MEAVEEIRYMWMSINDYLNKLELDILNDLVSKHSKLKLDMATLVQQIEQRTSPISQMQSKFIKMTQYATELQINNTVAFKSLNQTTLVDIKKNKIIQTIKLSHNCYGVASDGETLVISEDRKCTRVNLHDKSHTILSGMDGVFHISLFQGNIYGAIPEENKVCCFDNDDSV
ncbi:Hypothetical predicted protein [Mytilus galloprovincialis]|uniref:Uncharacterized protein n=1 Tax=Mytilus galloprovincialis TaxID=29158 RepID=A0A8B6ERW0_MYTGA|nr:Hypothetical predicted protein [Mytilus galloprovincialis]